MKRILSFVVIIILLYNCSLLPQSNEHKVAGVGFRIDDSTPDPFLRLNPLVNIFINRGLKFTYAVSFGYSTTSALLNYLPGFQNLGFEVADHTPDHETRLFYLTPADTIIYSGRPGVDHISVNWNNRAQVCLKVGTIKLDTYTNEGLINISGNTATSVNPNEFFDVKLPSSGAPDTFDPFSMNAIYIPDLDKIFKFLPSNVTANKIISLTSFWDEEINLIPLGPLRYEKLNLYDVDLTVDAHRLMAERTQRMCDAYGITYPKSWVQPGAYHPQFYTARLAEALGPMGYTSGGVFADPSEKCFNEYDPYNNCRFGLNWGDFKEIQTLSQWKNIIADRFARHFVSIGSSHLLTYEPSYSFPEFLQRANDILLWCLEKGIPVKTNREWAELLYSTPQYPNVNVMPSPDVDLDEDGNPDGFYNGTFYSPIIIDGEPNAFSKSFIQNGYNRICYIYQLGGVEKGENYFGIWIKGIGSVKVIINTGSQEPSYTFTSNSANWNYYHCTFQIPITTSALTYVDIFSKGTTGSIQVGGFELRKNYSNQIKPPFLYKPIFNSNTHAIPLVWLDNSSNETSFNVRRMFEHENIWKTIKEDLTANSTTWDDNLLDFPDSLLNYSSIKIYYEIIANLGISDSTLSNTQSIIIETSPLPVELSSFTAKYNYNKVQISWRTETEINNYGFEVERRTDIEWKKIGFVQGNGNSNSPKKYSFKDENLLGGDKFYYRLKQIDNDGKFSYSNTIEVLVLPIAFGLDQNYPNPFNPSTKISYQLPEKSRVYLKVFNSLGEEVATLLDDTKEPGNYEVDFNGANLSSGVYFYRIQAGDFISTKKMIIIK